MPNIFQTTGIHQDLDVTHNSLNNCSDGNICLQLDDLKFLFLQVKVDFFDMDIALNFYWKKISSFLLPKAEIQLQMKYAGSFHI